MSDTNTRYAQAMTDRYGLKLAAVLNQGTMELDHDITERLRAARERALAHRKAERMCHAPIWVDQGSTLAFGRGSDERMGMLGRLGSAMALCALVLGLLGINDLQDDARARELADIDLALLTDELPPAAFADPGFIQFLQKDM